MKLMMLFAAVEVMVFYSVVDVQFHSRMVGELLDQLEAHPWSGPILD